MSDGHQWKNCAPGNFCTLCGCDCPIEIALGCDECHVPCQEGDDPVERLCETHLKLPGMLPCRNAHLRKEPEDGIVRAREERS
jgi:hypothetical protein